MKSCSAPAAITLLLAFMLFPRLGSAASPTFAEVIEPLFAEHCLKCHGPEKQKGGLRLDVRASALRGGDSGKPALVPGHAAESRLFQLISSSHEEDRMPPKAPPLNTAQIADLQRWIDQGAEWPTDDGAVADVPAGASMIIITEDDRQHWSFRPLEMEVSPPEVDDLTWPRTPVDAFIRKAQENKNISPSPAAAPGILVRRLYFDLIGLPPSPEERRHWETRLQESPRDGVESLVEHLLALPQHGERWARHWLDVARYADSNGMEGDHDRPNAYHFRDFVIRALNADMAFDQFVRWQIAGDELEPGNPEAIAATGFLVAGTNEILNVPMEEEKMRGRANELDDMVSTTAQAFLGLTLACARCHDHKYDPLPTRDYYRLMRIFNGGDRGEVPLASPAEVAAHRQALEAWQSAHGNAVEARDAWLKENGVSGEKTLASLPAAERLRGQNLEDRVLSLAKRQPPALPTAFAFADFGPEPRVSWFFERGDFLARREQMDLGFLTVLTKGKSAQQYWDAARASKKRDDSTHQRTALAHWITDLDQGAGTLLARVMVNRVWQHHFGEGLVRTVSDFGTRGETPSHPDLLEWLAGEFVASGWSVKHLHRLMVKSATYQQGNAYPEHALESDPDNRLLWRRRPLRLEAEILRDTMLKVSGTLNAEMFGPSFKPPIAIEAMQARNVKNPYPKDLEDTSATHRRSVYMFHKRVVQYPLMQAFDAPDAQSSCGKRMNTTVAPQALSLLNDPFVRLRARELGQRLRAEAGNRHEDQVEKLFLLCLSREPAEAERSEAIAFLSAQAAARRARHAEHPEEEALTDLCQSLFGLNEFIYID